VTEPDLADRSVTLHLSYMAQRRSDTRLRKEFERERPAIFGALLDIVAHGLKQLPRTHLRDLARLADFVEWGVASEQAYSASGSFLAAFAASQTTAIDSVIEVNPVAAAIAAFMEDRSAWDGRTTPLWRELQAHDQTEARSTETKGWPRDPIAFGIALSKAVPILRKIGIEVTRDRLKDRKRTPMLHLRRIDREEQPQQQHRAAEESERSERSERSANDQALAKP
jgi:hypothetical protein